MKRRSSRGRALGRSGSLRRPAARRTDRRRFPLAERAFVRARRRRAQRTTSGRVVRGQPDACLRGAMRKSRRQEQLVQTHPAGLGKPHHEGRHATTRHGLAEV